MSGPLVSIVVPIYKVEQYLVRCLDSIVNQQYRPIELILVDDGSPDGCGDIIRRYEAQHPFIRSVWQENRGLSAARNAGIAIATGKYLAMIDSDDYVEPDFIGSLVEAAERENADVVICNFFLDFTNGFRIPFPLMTLQTNLSGEEAAQISLNLLRLPVFAWNKLYRTGLFAENDIKFPSIYYEDVATTPKVLMKARTVAVTQKPYYHYCLRRSSVTGNFGIKNITDYLAAVDIIRNFILKENPWISWQKPYRHFLRAVEAYLVLEVTLQKKTIPANSRRHLLHEIHTRIRELRLPPDLCPQESVSSSVNLKGDKLLGG
jgi:glycosyltransferase involved in cell wall biosynthesis